MIKQYDMKFGDCFLLEENEDNLYLVDFGSKKGYRSSIIKQRYNKVIDDLQNIGDEKVTFLLTHFHEDHYLGLLYMRSIMGVNFKFKKIIIPDIRNETITYILISSLFYKTFLESILLGKKTTKVFTNLFEISDYFLDDENDLKFVSRGNSFDDKEILWPIKGDNEEEKSNIYSNFKNLIDVEDVDKYIKNCASAWYEMLTYGESYINNENELYDKFIKLDCIINDLLKNKYHGIKKEISISNIHEILNKLDYMNHRYNIVFQNTERNGKNFLFTGDIRPTDLKKILDNSVKPSIKLRDYYMYIKIPHHGTKDYFFDFSDKMESDSVLMISNGKYSNWKIFQDYCDEYVGYKHVCSNCNHCESFLNNAKTCRCQNYNIIYPGFSITI